MATLDSLSSSGQLIITGFKANNVTRFAFVPNMVDGTLSAYTTNPASGQLRHNGYQLVGEFPSSVVVEPRNEFVYVANSGRTAADGSISGFAIDESGNLALFPVLRSKTKDRHRLSPWIPPAPTYIAEEATRFLPTQ